MFVLVLVRVLVIDIVLVLAIVIVIGSGGERTFDYEHATRAIDFTLGRFSAELTNSMWTDL